MHVGRSCSSLTHGKHLVVRTRLARKKLLQNTLFKQNLLTINHVILPILRSELPQRTRNTLLQMPSKGIQLYTFIGIEKCQVSYSVPGFAIIRERQGAYNDHVEVDKAQISGLFSFVGRFQFNVKVNGKAITSQYVDINTLTGNMESGTMKSNVDQRSIVTNELIVTYGLYDAGQGQAGLPKSEQCYVTVTQNRSNWQGNLVPGGSTQEQKPFSLFVLPSAHDIGMNSMETTDLLLQKAATPFLGVLKNVGVINTVANSMSDAMLMGLAPNIVRSLA